MERLIGGLIGFFCGAREREERTTGIAMDLEGAWEIKGRVDYVLFFRCVGQILPQGAILCLEGTPDPDVEEYLSTRKATQVRQVRRGTLGEASWEIGLFHISRKRIGQYHMPATPENLEGIAALAENHASPEVCNHLVIYKDGQVLAEWYDFPCEDQWYVARDISEESVRQFCACLGCRYIRFQYD